VRNAKPVFAAPRVELERAWSEVTFRMQQLRDEPDCAKEEFDRILDREDPGLTAVLTFDPAGDIAAPFIAKGVRRRSRSCASRESTVRSKWPRRSIGPDSTRTTFT